MAGLLGQLDELVGLHHAPLRMRPPHQGFEPGDFAAAQSHDGLIHEGKARAGDRLLQRGLHLPAADHPGTQHGLVAAPLPFAGRLGGVQGQVRVAEQLVHVGTVRRRGHADRGGGDHRTVSERERLAEGADHVLGKGLHRGRIRGLLDEQREFIAAEPRRGVAVPDHGGQPYRGRGQEFVADAVAHRVVGDLEIVQIHEQHAGRRPVAPGPGESAGGAVLEQQPVGQPGQRVVEGAVLQLILQLTLLGHVPHRQDQAAHGVIAAQVAAPDLDLDVKAVAPGDLPVLVVGAVPHVSPHPVQRADDLGPPAVRDQLPEGGALHADVAEDALRRGRRVPDLPVVTDDEDDVRGVLDERPEVGLAALADDFLAQRDALDRQRDLMSQDFKGQRQAGQRPLFTECGQRPDERVARRPVPERQRAEQDPVAAGQQRPGLRTELRGRHEQRHRPGEQRQPRFGRFREPAHRGGISAVGRDGAEITVVPDQEQRLRRRVRSGQGRRYPPHRDGRLLHGGGRGERRAGHPYRALTGQRAAVRRRHVP